MEGAFRIAILTVENTSRQQDPDISRLQRGITPQVSEPLQTRWGSTSNGHVLTGDEDFACELDCQLAQIRKSFPVRYSSETAVASKGSGPSSGALRTPSNGVRVGRGVSSEDLVRTG